MLYRVLFLVLAVSTLTLGEDPQCNPNLPPCKLNSDVALITCKKGEQCKSEQDLGDLLEGMDKMDPLICAKTCQQQNENFEGNKCLYYRMEYDRDHNYNCSLQTSCITDSSCRPTLCVSGEVNCDVDGNPLPTESCTIAKATEYNKNKVHITCMEPKPSFQDFNIYDNENVNKDIDGGTWCITTRRCADWNEVTDEENNPFYRKLGMECTDGKWVAKSNTGSQELSAAMYDDTNKIFVEPECETMTKECDPMTLTYTDQRGLRLMCDKPIRGNTLTDHSCILTCDNHFMMGIDCKMSEDGEKVWLDNNGEVVTDDRVRCWGRSK